MGFLGGHSKSFIIVHYTGNILTLSAIPKLLRTSAKATARLNPLWDRATLLCSAHLADMTCLYKPIDVVAVPGGESKSLYSCTIGALGTSLASQEEAIGKALLY